MLEAIIAGLSIFAIIAGVNFCYNRYQLTRQKNALISLLRKNTRDEPGESHISVSEAALHLGITIEEVNRLVSSTEEILRSRLKPDQISIWREDSQSIYEKRGILEI